MSQDVSSEPSASVFASAHAHELIAVLDSLSAAGIPAVWARGKSLAALGVPTSRGGRYDVVTHILVPPSRLPAARALLETFPFAGRPEPASHMSGAELRRGNRILVVVGIVLVAWMLFVIVFNPQLTPQRMMAFFRRLLP